MLSYYRNLGFPFYYTLLAALGISTFFVLQGYINHEINQYNFPFSWFSVSSKIFFGYLIWAFLSPLNKSFVTELRSITFQRSIKLFLGSVLISFVHRSLVILFVAVVIFMRDGIWQELTHSRNAIQMGAGIFSSFLEFWVITAIFFAIAYYHRYLEKQRELTNAQLTALKMQLHPHFLFNTLHAISSLMEEDVKGAQKMITQLGDLLRSILEKDRKHTISFQEELTYIKNYLEIERIRFQDRLKIDYEIEKDTLEVEVPTLILQPLVENAIKHGISKVHEGGDIRIHAKVVNGNAQSRYIELSVEDNGLGAAKTKTTKRRGVGLRNIRERLYQLYEEDFTFTTSPLSNGKRGFRALMTFPIRN